MWGNYGKMPGRTDIQTQESGRATAPPGVVYPGYNAVTNNNNNTTIPQKYPQYAPCLGISHSNTSNQIQSPKYTPNYANVPFLAPKSSEEPPKKPTKATKDDSELGYNFSELQQFLAKQKPDSVADCLLNFIQKKQEEDGSTGKKCNRKQANSTMNSQYHHHHDERKRGTYTDYPPQWEFQQEHHRRPFCSQPAPWGPMTAMGMPGMPGMSSIAGLPGPHQGNPYYANPHVMPAHAHSTPDFRYAQWNSGKIQNAHSSQSSKNTHLVESPVTSPPNKPSMANPLSELQALILPENPNKSPKIGGKSPHDTSNYQQESVDLSCQQPVPLTVDRDKEITSTNNEEDQQKITLPPDRPEEKVETDNSVEVKENESALPILPLRTEVPPLGSPEKQVEEILPKPESTIDPPKAPKSPESTENPPENAPENIIQEIEIKPEIEPIPELESQPTVSSTSVDKPPPKESCKKKVGKGKNLKKGPKGKKLVKKVAKTKAKVAKISEVETRKGPFLQIKGSRDNLISVTVVNCPRGEDDDEKDKKLAASSRPRSHHHIDLKRRGRRDLFSSTLSSRYDAARPDLTWVCIFCKQGSHKCGLGDLFGPYCISKDSGSDQDLSIELDDEINIAEMQISGGRNKRSLRASGLLEHYRHLSKRLKKSNSCDPDETYVGMTPLDSSEQYEVWTHEMCAIWSSSIYLLDTKLMGLQEAIWLSHSTVCSKCGKPGANISCIHRNCPNRSHYPCAEKSGWSLPLDTFIATCHIHIRST